MLEAKDRDWVFERVEHYRREYGVSAIITVGPIDDHRDIIMVSSKAGRPDTLYFTDAHFLPGQLHHTESQIARWVKALREGAEAT